MPYTNLTDEEVVRLARKIPERSEWVALHKYSDEMSEQRQLKDDVKSRIPRAWGKSLGDSLGSQEGGAELNDHVLMLGSWLDSQRWKLQVWPASEDSTDVDAATLQERLINAAERNYEGFDRLHPYRTESNEHIAHCGLSVIRQHPRARYYTEMPERRLVDEAPEGEEGDFESNPVFDRRFTRDGTQPVKSFPLRENRDVFNQRRADYIDGTFITDLWVKEAVHPRSFSADPHPDPKILFAATVEITVRPMGEVADEFGIDAVRELFGFFAFGKGAKPDDRSSWDQDTLQTREVWTGDMGYLVILDGGTAELKRVRPNNLDGVILHRWPNQLGRPPYHLRMFKAMPWESPLDKMLVYTPERNEAATLLALQRRQGVFRFPQEVDIRNVADTEPLDVEDEEPEEVAYDPDKPLPSPQPGKQWLGSPYDFIPNILEEYKEVVAKHESAGAVIAALFGAKVGPNTAVGTADAADEQSKRRFTFLLQSIGDSLADEWRVFLGWYGTHHKNDTVKIWDLEAPHIGSSDDPRRITRTLKGSEVVSEHVEAILQPRSLITSIALFEMALKMMDHGDLTYDQAVAQGWIPGVDDANHMERSVFLSRLKRGMAQNMLEVTISNHRTMLEGQLPAPVSPDSDALGGAAGADPRNPGKSPLRISDSAIGGADVGGRPPAPAAAAGG